MTHIEALILCFHLAHINLLFWSWIPEEMTIRHLLETTMRRMNAATDTGEP